MTELTPAQLDAHAATALDVTKAVQRWEQEHAAPGTQRAFRAKLHAGMADFATADHPDDAYQALCSVAAAAMALMVRIKIEGRVP